LNKSTDPSDFTAIKFFAPAIKCGRFCFAIKISTSKIILKSSREGEPQNFLTGNFKYVVLFSKTKIHYYVDCFISLQGDWQQNNYFHIILKQAEEI